MPGHRYTAIFERDDKGMWLVGLAEQPRVRSYGRTLAAARDGIRRAAATWAELEPTDFELVEDVRLPDKIKTRVHAAREQREQAQQALETARAESRIAARLLVHSIGLSMRDAADLLGLSPQRIQQLVTDD